MLKLITCYDKNFLIGKDKELPWRIPEELKHFQEETLNKTIVLGENTFLGMKKPLLNRVTIVLTKDPFFKASAANVIVMNSVEDVLEYARDKEVYISGGAIIYKLFLPYVNEMIITELNTTYKGNIYFPKWDKNAFKIEKIFPKKYGKIIYYKRI